MQELVVVEVLLIIMAVLEVLEVVALEQVALLKVLHIKQQVELLTQVVVAVRHLMTLQVQDWQEEQVVQE